MARAAVIFNPISGSGLGEAASIAAENSLCRDGWQVERIPTRDRSGAAPIARRLAEKVDLLVIAGGDGSIREVIEGLEDAAGHVKLGLVPAGNANVIARELGIPLAPDAAVGILSSETAVPVDLGSVNGELFLAMVGVGWDALTVRYLDCLRHSKLGSAWYRTWADSAYAAAGLVAAFHVRPPRFRLTCDGKMQTHHYCAALFCNVRNYGKGWAMAPEAHFQSGKLHFQARKRSSPLFLAWHVAAAALQKKSPRLISDYGTGEYLVVECERSFPVQADGDFKGYFKRLELSLDAAAVRILVPRARQAVLESARQPHVPQLRAPAATG
jgi:diacylglycerol kinase family enzyme